MLYDALVSTAILKLAPRARCFCVGKRAGGDGVPQAAINRLMRRSARRGERVVRLKCGDPFVLGRGGEEALALVSDGMAVEVVPGVSAAIAAPALAGIPVTHRGVASGFVVISGHAEDAYRAVVDSLAPGSLTLVVLMGLAARCAIARALLDRGWRGRTPAGTALRPEARGRRCGASDQPGFQGVVEWLRYPCRRHQPRAVLASSGLPPHCWERSCCWASCVLL